MFRKFRNDAKVIRPAFTADSDFFTGFHSQRVFDMVYVRACNGNKFPSHLCVFYKKLLHWLLLYGSNADPFALTVNFVYFHACRLYCFPDFIFFKINYAGRKKPAARF